MVCPSSHGSWMHTLRVCITPQHCIQALTCASGTPQSAKMPLRLVSRCPGSCTHLRHAECVRSSQHRKGALGCLPASRVHSGELLLQRNSCPRPLQLACSGKVKMGVGLRMRPVAGSAGSQILIRPSRLALTMCPSQTVKSVMQGTSLPLCALSTVCRTVPVVKSHTCSSSIRGAAKHAAALMRGLAGQAHPRGRPQHTAVCTCRRPPPIAGLDRCRCHGSSSTDLERAQVVS